MEIKFSTNGTMYTNVKVPLAAHFDDKGLTFTVDMHHEHAARLTELALQTVKEAEKPMGDYVGETPDEMVKTFKIALDAIVNEVESLSNEETAMAYTSMCMYLRRKAIMERMEEKAYAFLDRHDTEVECPEYGTLFLTALNENVGAEGVLMLGYLMGRGICDGWGNDVATSGKASSVATENKKEAQKRRGLR